MGRPAKPMWIDVAWNLVSSPCVFQVIFYAPDGEELTRSKPLVSSYTVQRMRLRAPPATDYGTYSNTVPLVSVKIESTSASTTPGIMLSFNARLCYKPAESIEIL